MPRQSYPSCTSGQRSTSACAARSASSSFPASMRAITALAAASILALQSLQRRVGGGGEGAGGGWHAGARRRKPRARPVALGEEHDRRFSFCCAVDGCRDRSTPPSLRFLGRKVYLAVIVTLISAMRDGLTERRLGKLSAALGVARRTVARWRRWW